MSTLHFVPSEYAFTKAVPLQYFADPQASPPSATSPFSLPEAPSPDRPAVPLTALFPVFASSPSIQKTAPPVPIVHLCNAASPTTFSHIDATTSLSLCVLDACKDPLAKVAADKASYESLIVAFNGGQRGMSAWSTAAAQEVIKHFDTHNALEECAIRSCPTEYFLAHATVCVSLRHPFFVQRNIYLPELPPFHSNPSARTIDYSVTDGQVLSEYLSQVQTGGKPTRVGTRNTVFDLGIYLPALPAGFPCDPTRMDQASGALLAANTVGNSVAGMDPWIASHFVQPTGTWMTSADNSQWALMHNASADLGAVNSWVVKSTLLRGGMDGLGASDKGTVRQTLATVPANVYALGHCPKATREVVGSKLSGEACTRSMECVFSSCVNGMCAEAATGKQLDVATAFTLTRDTMLGQKEREKRAVAAWWMALAGGIVGGLIVLRIIQLLVRRWWSQRQRRAKQQAERDEPPMLEAVETVTPS